MKNITGMREENYLKSNIKYLREEKGMSQLQLAEAIGCSRDNIASYERGTEPKLAMLRMIVNYFHVSIDDITSMDLSKHSTSILHHKKNIKQLHSGVSPGIVSEPAGQYISEDIISIPIVDVAAAAGYGYSNPDYTETLGELRVPANMIAKRTGNYYCGRVDGDSMVPTLLYGDFIIFRLLSPAEWGDIKDGDVYFVVNRSGHAFVKRIKNRLIQEGFIICQSDNPDKINKDFSIFNDDISNIYHVEWRFSNDMTNINQLYFSRLDALENQMRNVQKIIKKLP